uniref:(northern house mosquito) hypothetical protein n=1 Tax=Culex pipiens TaxID=7175 RepID=A0A8D8BLQ3_CULPI
MMDVCALLAFCLLTLAHTITSTKVQIFLQPPLLVCPSSSNAAEATLLERDFHCFFVGDALLVTTLVSKKFFSPLFSNKTGASHGQKRLNLKHFPCCQPSTQPERFGGTLNLHNMF